MNRFLGVLGLALLVAGTTNADIGPPKGLKRIPIDHKITTEKEYPDYNFYLVIGRTISEVKFDPKNPVVIAGAKRAGIGRLCNFSAVPRDAAKKYDSEKDFLAAVLDGKVEGQIRAKTDFGASADVKESDTRKVIVMEHTLEKLSPKDGMVLKSGADGSRPKDGPEEEEGVTAYTPRGGLWVAGLAGTAAIVLAGFWLARRGRTAA